MVVNVRMYRPQAVTIGLLVQSVSRLHVIQGSQTLILSITACCVHTESLRLLLLEHGMLFRRLFVLLHCCCSSAAT